MMKKLTFSIAIILALAIPAVSTADTKLTALPERATLVVNMQHPNHVLLYEERDLPLQEGTNQIDFSWQGVNIDPSSIRLEMMDNPGDGNSATKIISVAFPPGQPSLRWQIYTPAARSERVRVSYLLYGVGREVSYESQVNPEETKAIFAQYYRVDNFSGEDFDKAVIRTVMADDWNRTVKSGERRQFVSFRAEDLPITKVYETRPSPHSSGNDDGETISMIYEFANTRSNNLGRFMLDGGKSRFFAHREDGSIFTGEDFLRTTAPGEKAALRLGTVKDVLLKRYIMKDQLTTVKTNKNGRPVLSTRNVEVRYAIENFKDKPSTVRVIEQIPPDAKLIESSTQGVTVKRKSGQEVEILIELEARPADPNAEVPVREVLFQYAVENVLT